MPSKKKFQADLDWENRTLCLDESCIGVIGPDGRCKECGKTYEGYEYRTVDTEDTDVTDVTDVSDAPDESRSETDEPDQATTDPNDWGNRTLCVDESCIGVIGPDGRCKECGMPFEKNG